MIPEYSNGVYVEDNGTDYEWATSAHVEFVQNRLGLRIVRRTDMRHVVVSLDREQFSHLDTMEDFRLAIVWTYVVHIAAQWDHVYKEFMHTNSEQPVRMGHLPMKMGATRYGRNNCPHVSGIGDRAID